MGNEYWEKINEQLYSKDIYSRDEEVHKFILNQIPAAKNNLNIIDIGCGDGTLLAKIKKGNNLYGTDIVESQLVKAEKIGAKTAIVNIDEKPLPYENDFFDVAIASEVIEHLFLPDNLIKEAYRILKPGGKLILTTPNVASLGRRMLLLFGRQAFLEVSPYEENAVGHLRYFTAESLKKLAEKYGFKLNKLSSDVVNFNAKRILSSKKLAKIFPTFGKTLLCVFKK